jgi:hypothetical protein
LANSSSRMMILCSNASRVGLLLKDIPPVQQ